MRFNYVRREPFTSARGGGKNVTFQFGFNITVGARARAVFSVLKVHFTFIDFFTSRFLCSNPPGFRGKPNAVASIFIGQNGENAQTPIKLLRPCRKSGVCRVGGHVRARLVQIEFGVRPKRIA